MSNAKGTRENSEVSIEHIDDTCSLSPIWTDSSILTPEYDDAAIKKIYSDNASEHKLSEKELRIYVALLSYVRRAPGTVNKYDLTSNIPNLSERNYINRINYAFGIDLLEEQANGTKNTDLNTVVTSYRYRHIIDQFLDMFTEGDKFFNPLLFSENVKYENPKTEDSEIRIQFVTAPSFQVETNDNEIIIYTEPEEIADTPKETIINKKSIAPEMVLIYEEITKRLNNIEKSYKIPELENFDGSQCFENCFFSEDDTKKLLGKSSYINLVLSDCYFEGKLIFREKSFTGCVDFSRTLFAEEVAFENCTFNFSTEKNSAHNEFYSNSDCMLCFREANIKANMRFNACRLESSQSTRHSRLTFEDAIFSSGKANTELIMRGNAISGVKLDFFETNLATVRMELSNSILTDSSINFDGSRMRNRIVLSNLELCPCRMNFAIGNRVIIANCNLDYDLHISNIAQFEMINTTVVGGGIYSLPSWDFVKNKSQVKTAFDHPYLSDKFYPANPHPLLLACVGSLDEVSKQFLILHKCFDNQGDFNSSDDAYLLYLRTKTANMKSLPKKLFYKSLDCIGEYGISPKRVAFSTLCLIEVSFFLYFFLSLILHVDISCFQCLYWAFINTINIQDMSEYPNIFGIVATIHTYIGWVFLAYFSMAIIRKTIRE